MLCFTIQTLLKHIEPNLVVGDLDASVIVLSNVFHSELFSQISEEKDVKQIVAKVMEAKMTSSYTSYEIVSKYVSKSYLLELIKPLNQVLILSKIEKILELLIYFMILGIEYL